MKSSESIVKLAGALLKAQVAMQAAHKSATNPHFKSKYADLATVIDAVKEPLNTAGIVFLQSITNDSTGVMVTTRFLHESGEYVEETLYLPVAQQTAQAYGSAITYAKRYGLQSMAGLPSEDDDGQAASAPSAEKKGFSAPISGAGVVKEEFDALTPEVKDFVLSHANHITRLHGAGADMYAYVEDQKFDDETKMALWHLLPSNIRSAIKKQAPKHSLASQA